MLVTVLRIVIGTALGASALIAIGSWAVTTRRINPFGRTARLIRGTSDPVLVPIERLLLSRGGNPQQAPWWLLGAVIVGGILLLSGIQFVAGLIWNVMQAVRAGPRSIAELSVWAASNILMLSLVVRVVGSWLGAGRYNKLTGWSWRMTDWLVRPIQRWLPPYGMLDFSPLVAWFVIWVGQRLLLTMIARI